MALAITFETDKTKLPTCLFREGFVNLGLVQHDIIHLLGKEMTNKKHKPAGLSIQPVEIEDNADRLSTKDFIDEFGDSALASAMSNLPTTSNSASMEGGLQAVIDAAKDLMREREASALSRVDVLKEQTDSLGRCVFLASQIYENSPIPDHAYQLSALTSAFNASLAQVEKMNDPVQTFNQINELMEAMFTEFVSKMAVGIDRVRKDLGKQNPDLINSVNAHFERMLREMSPETSANYDKLQTELRKILGIRQKKPGNGSNSQSGQP